MPRPPRSWAMIAPHLTAEVMAKLSLRITKGAPDECWPCAGLHSSGGYGTVNVPGVYGPVGAHRIIFAKANPSVDFEGLYILHRCDNPVCCNPSHLFSGTHTDNMRDMADKGRGHAGDETCKHGHVYANGNYVTTIGPAGRKYRKCLVCRANVEARKKSARKTAMLETVSSGYLPELRGFAARNLPDTFISLCAGVGHRRAIAIAYSFAAYGFPYRTLTDMGADFGISRERVRQLRASGLDRLSVSEALPECLRSAAITEGRSHTVSESTSQELVAA